ncbi:MAG: preprotein translocase subunit SecA [Bacillota bacterium]
MGFFDRFFQKEKTRQIKKVELIADAITALEPKYSALNDVELAGQTDILRARYKGGESLDKLLNDAFAVVREASKRVLNMRHFDVQLVGGIVLHQGRIAEMHTGEGKTLVATLPAYLNALSGKGVHVVTVNDYLAKRDAEWMGKIYKFLGMTVGVVVPGMSFEDKKAAYDADITYATNNEIGFDYLRDNMATTLKRVLQRGHNFAIVDEVDSILIDEARTPLIISAPAGESGDIYVKVNRFIRTLQEEDYTLDEKDKHIFLSEDGIEKAERYFNLENLGDAENADLSTKINSGLRANFIMSADKDYIVEDGQIIIVDEYTGRKMSGRRYSAGLHQAIEAKENVVVKKENRTIATITFQNYFRLYAKLSGMTGTAITEEDEFRGIYSLDVVPIPTNIPVSRVDEADKVYLTKKVKFENIIADIKEAHKLGQPVLVGTTNVEASEFLSRLLNGAGVRHNVLNAKKHLEEASIIAQAGCRGAVTIATNMAGRGTDILLGGNPEFKTKQKMAAEGFSAELITIASAHNTLSEPDEIRARERFEVLMTMFKKDTDAEKAEVKSLGGLRVIGTERHESRRIDNQLRGRSGRQGDEGSSCFYLSFEDDLLRLFGGEKLGALVGTLTKDDDACIQSAMLAKQIETAQRRCEESQFQRRKIVLNFDDVMNKQRQLIYTQRNEVLGGKDVHDQILAFIKPLGEEIVSAFVDFEAGDETTIDYASLNRQLEIKLLKKDTEIVTEELCKHLRYDDVEDAVYDEAIRQYEEKMAFAKDNNINFLETERSVLLNQVDRHWMEHIESMDQLRKGIGLRGYGQRDPVMEYRREGFVMFDEMVESIRNSTASILSKMNVEAIVERINAHTAMQERRKTVVNNNPNKNVGPNDKCPCGSGKKYKKCCGK